MKKKRVLVVFGTRPEAIKMCPLVKELKKRERFEVAVCVTGQHQEMLQQVLDAFQVEPDFNLFVMKKEQTLADISSAILEKITVIYRDWKPDIVLVHGDTSTAFSSALAAFYMQIPIGHVEAGLRTWRMDSPFPEEFNRQAVGLIAQYHFAPTEKAKENLIKEGKKIEQIFVTGNTAIDALNYTITKQYENDNLNWASDSRLILLTAHRRENLGEPLREMFRAINRVLTEYSDVKAIYPVHLNPKVREAANEVFIGQERMRIMEPLDVIAFHNFMDRSYLIMTDSGGIQEEAPSLGKPVLVMRDTTERPEGVAAGTLKLVGTKEEDVYKELCKLLDSKEEYEQMSMASNPYGDGSSCKQIADILEMEL